MALSGADKAYKEARAGIARAGATRASYATRWPITVIIGSTDRSASVVKQTLSITRVLNQPGSATLRVYGFAPTVGQAITISLGDAADNLLFKGRILRVETRLAARSVGTVVYDLTCADPTWDLDRRLVMGRWVSQSAGEMVRDIVNTFTTGFTVQHVQHVATIDAIDLRMVPVSEALQQIADAASAAWYVDLRNDVHFYLTETLDGPCETLSTASAHEWRQLVVESDLTQVRTRVYVEGVRTELLDVVSTPGSVTATYDSDGLAHAGTFNGDYATATVNGGLQVANGLPWTAGSDRIRVDAALYDPLTYATSGYTRTTASTGNVTDTTLALSSNPSYGGSGTSVCYVNGQTLTYTGLSASGLVGIPATGPGSIRETIGSGSTVIFPPTLVPNITLLAGPHDTSSEVALVMIRNDASAQSDLTALDGSDGIREHYISDGRASRLGCLVLADADLQLYSAPKTGIRYSTRDPNVWPGKRVSIDVAGLTGTYTIQKVVIRDVEDALTRYPWRDVEAATVRDDFYTLLRYLERRSVY